MSAILVVGNLLLLLWLPIGDPGHYIGDHQLCLLCLLLMVVGSHLCLLWPPTGDPGHYIGDHQLCLLCLLLMLPNHRDHHKLYALQYFSLSQVVCVNIKYKIAM